MRLISGALGLLLLVSSCSDAGKGPDVSGIKINLAVQRFEKDFFAADTTRLDAELERLNQAYPGFLPNFMVRILNADTRWPKDSVTSYVKHFIMPFRIVNDSAQRLFSDFSPYEKEIRQALQYLRHYFPAYKAPGKVITYIGPLDGYGDIIAPDAFIVGLHHHLGAASDFYKSDMVAQTYPAYITQHFTPASIAVNCMRNVVDELLPEADADQPLVQQMVQQGKKLYILSKLLPAHSEDELIGYSARQLKECYQREANIWDLFVQNNYLQITDKNIIKNYIGPSPKTQELGEASPGNIASFAGWQVVKKYMAKNPSTTLEQLVKLDANELYQMAKYKP